MNYCSSTDLVRPSMLFTTLFFQGGSFAVQSPKIIRSLNQRMARGRSQFVTRSLQAAGQVVCSSPVRLFARSRSETLPVASQTESFARKCVEKSPQRKPIYSQSPRVWASAHLFSDNCGALGHLTGAGRPERACPQQSLRISTLRAGRARPGRLETGMLPAGSATQFPILKAQIMPLANARASLPWLRF